MSIATQIEALQNDKAAIASAITSKGGTVGETDGFDDFATAIGTIRAAGNMEFGTFTPAVDTFTFNVSNLAFTPTKIYILCVEAYKTTSATATNFLLLDMNGSNNRFIWSVTRENNGAINNQITKAQYEAVWINSFYISNNSFSCDISAWTISGYPGESFPFKAGYTYTWIACA